MKRVYFIAPVGQLGPVKIGCAADPAARLLQFQAGSPVELEIAADISGDHQLEKRFHAKFEATFRRHEWFSWTPELGAVIADIRAGTFDPEALPAAKRMWNNPNWRDQRDKSLRVDTLAKAQQILTDLEKTISA